MVPVKIACECGQNYAFDVEPVNGRMPSTVSCPSCGVDGTAAANDYISRQSPVIAATPPAFTPAPATGPGPALRIARAQSEAPAQAHFQPAAAAALASASAAAAGIDPARAKLVREARAKMVGGDSMEQVAAFLKVKGFDPAEAMDLARGFYQERVSIVRSNGVKKAIVGLVLVAVPFIAYFAFKAAGHFSIRRKICPEIRTNGSGREWLIKDGGW